jgi:hypothetical protein
VGEPLGALSAWGGTPRLRRQRREFHEALLEADTFEELPRKWQAAILTAEQNRPKLRVIN